MRPNISLGDFYDEYPRIEDAFQAELDKSLGPRGPEFLFEMVGKLELPPGAIAVDVGCGEGRQAIKLAKDFGFAVLGIDPVPRHIELGNEALLGAAKEKPELRDLVRFELGTADAIPTEDTSVDLIWCREVLYHIDALDKAFAECRRVLRDDGRMLVHHMFATDQLEEKEAARMWNTLDTSSFETGHNVFPASANPGQVEAAFTRAGFKIDQVVVLGSEWGEYAQETSGSGGRRLLHLARLQREPERYLARFGRANYDVMLGDCLWHIYRMIGKLSGRVYLLRAPGP